MKKTFIILVLCLACALVLCGLTACADSTSDDEGISVVCTVFPAYDWAKNVIGENNASLTLLLDSGADLHNYNPTVRDMLLISKCDVFVYVGGESDEKWVDDVLRAYPNENRVAINLMEVLGDRALEEEELEGAEEEDHDHDHEEEEEEYDEHIWLSLKNAVVCVNAISSRLGKIDPDHAESYSQNAATYVGKLNALDSSYVQATKDAPVKTLVFCDRFPFLYMMKDYDLTYFAAFSGCSTETNASFATIHFLATKVNEYDLKNVVVLESSDQEIARSVIRETTKKNQTILCLDSLQSAGKTEVDNGTTYLSVMEKNLDVLKKAIR